MIPHENFDILANDIALIRVKDEIEFNDLVSPIGYSKNYIESGSILSLTGWGQIDQSTIPDQLQVLNVTSISNDECDRYFPTIIKESHLCTINKVGEGPCYVSFS